MHIPIVALNSKHIDAVCMVDTFVALTPEECSRWSQKVLSNHSLWRKRVRGIDYYSLGISYDVYPRYSNANQLWENVVLQNNKRMRGVFDDLYKKVVALFARFFGKSIVMSDCLAVPGFNIYGPRPGSKPAFFNSVFYEYGGHIHNHPTPKWMHKALEMRETEVPSIIHSVQFLCNYRQLGGFEYLAKQRYRYAAFLPSLLGGNCLWV